jgi:hypothetical protein
MRIIDFSDGFETDVQPDSIGLPASAVEVTPAGTVASDNVQDAIEELDSEKIAKVTSTDHAVVRFTGTGGDVQNSGVTIDDSDNMIVPGNLTVEGTTTTINSTNLEVEDRNITVNNGGNDASADGAGLTIERTGTNGSFVYDSTKASMFKAGDEGSEIELVNVSSSQVLTNKDIDGGTASNTSRITVPKAAKTTLDGLTRKQGALVYASDTDKVYYDTGAQLKEVGSGSGAGANNLVEYISNGTAETDTTGWATYADAAAATPVDGTGGSPNITLVQTTTSSEVLRGLGSFKLVKDASNRQGEGVSYDFTVDRQDYKNSRAVYLSFDFQATANYAASDIQVFVYDKDAASLLTVFDSNNLNGAVPASTNGARFTGYFYPTTSTSNDYRLIFHITSTNASAYDFIFDSVHAGSINVVPGANITDLGTETWADDQGNATTSVRLTLIGNRVLAEGTTSFTGAATTGLNITIPAKYTADSRYVFGTAQKIAVGKTDMFDVSAGGAGFGGGAYLTSSTNLLIRYYDPTNGTTIDGEITSTAPFTWANGDKATWRADWAVLNWTTGASLSTSEAMVSTAKFAASKSGDQAISSTSATKITWDTVAKDNLGWWDATNNRFKVKKKGRYLVNVGVRLSSASDENYFLYAYVNGSATRFASGTTSGGLNGSVSLDLNVDDYIETFVQSSADSSYNVATSNGTYFSITEQPDFSIFSTYGTFEILNATSSVKTAAGNGHYQSLTGNSLTLTPGTWRLTGCVNFGSSGSPAYTSHGAGYYAANGADSSSVPALITTLTGLTVLTQIGTDGISGLDNYITPPASAGGSLPVPPVIVRVTQNTTIYLVSFSNQTTAANTRITAKFSAERLQ